MIVLSLLSLMGTTVDPSGKDSGDVLAMSDEVLISRQIRSTLELTLLTSDRLWHDEIDMVSPTRSLTLSLWPTDSDPLWHTHWCALWHVLSDTFSLTCYFWHVLSDMISLTPSPWHALSDMLSLTWCLLHYLSDMVSLTWSLWHSNSLKHNENLTTNSLSDNTRIFACVFHHHYAVHIPVDIHLPLPSICSTGANERWFFHEGCPRTNRTAAIEFRYQNRVPFPSISTKLSSHLHERPSISSMSAMSWASWSWFLALRSGITSLCFRMLLSFMLPMLVSTIE